jgi:glycolate oxidase FAD binding subunit
MALAAAPLELETLDVAWSEGRGELLARAAGAEPRKRAERAVAMMHETGFDQIDVVDDDDALWARQRAGQRSGTAALVRINARPSRLAEVMAVAESCNGALVGRAALGTSYVECDPSAVARVRQALPDQARAIVLDGPAELDRWDVPDDPALELMRRVKRRFDPTGMCSPGVFVGGI